MKDAYEKESKPLAKQILGQLLENLDIAGKDMIPICQGYRYGCGVFKDRPRRAF